MHLSENFGRVFSRMKEEDEPREKKRNFTYILWDE